MTPQLIVDCGGRVLSALLVTDDGQLVPWSQDIRNVATRHVSMDVLFEPRASEHPDFSWDESLETLARATSANFFQRARRIGLRRPWDPQVSADALRLRSPLAVLSSAAALADRSVSDVLPHAAAAMLRAFLDPVFAFLADLRIAPAAIESYVVLPSQASRIARTLVRRTFRRRGFRRLAIVPRELAAAMFQEPASTCTVVDASDVDLHLHRVVIDGNASERRFRTATSTMLNGFGRSRWIALIASALGTAPSAAFERSLMSLLTGSPDALEPRVTRAALQTALDAPWIEARRAELRDVLPPLDSPVLFIGELFALDAMRRLFGDDASRTSMLDHTVRAVASALLWRRADESRRLVLADRGTVRVNTVRDGAVELLSHDELPSPGEACHVDSEFRFAGDGASSFLVQLLWGCDRAPEGNVTLCAVPAPVRHEQGDALRLRIHLRRSGDGSRLTGKVEARTPRNAIAATARFTRELEVRR